MLRRPKNLTESLFPLLCTYALIGHGIFRFPAQQQRPVFSVIYAVIFTTLYHIALGFNLKFIFNEPWYSDDDRIVFSVIYVNVGIAIFGVILSWCNAKRFARIIADLTKVDETLQELGATFDYTRARNEGYRLIIMWIIMIAVFNWVDTLWFHNIMSASQTYLVASILHHPVHINTIVASNFCLSVRVVGARYREANKILERLTKSVQPIKINAWEHLREKMIFRPMVTVSPFRTRRILRVTQNPEYLIQIIKHVHLELGKVGKGVNKAYGIQMVLEIAALFVLFTGLLYELYVLAFNPTVSGRFSRILIIGIWIITYLVKLIIVNEICERVCTEARRTGKIVHCLGGNIRDSELSNETSQFSLQLLHDPLAFIPAGFITLGHRFVKNFFASVTTYLVILIQMNPSQI